MLDVQIKVNRAPVLLSFVQRVLLLKVQPLVFQVFFLGSNVALQSVVAVILNEKTKYTLIIDYY